MDRNSTIELRSGRAMPLLGLGTWELTEDTAGTVERALELGYRMIDTSRDYGTQPGIGEALRRSGVDRERIYLVTKVEEDDDAYAATRRDLDELDQGYADLMLVHRPPEDGVGPRLLEGLARARDDGLTRDIGVSNYSVDEMEKLIAETGETPAVNQIEWTPFGWSREMLQYCRDRGIVIQAYSPLTRAERLGDERLGKMADRYDCTPAQLLLRWALHLGTVPLPKANREAHLEENLGAFDVEVEEDDLRRMSEWNEAWSSLGEAPQYV